MALYGTMRLPHEWKIQNTNHRHSNQISVVGKGQVHFVSINLSSHGLRHDSWSLHLLSSRHSPISPISGRCKVFFCRSVLVPSAGNEFPLLKSAAIVLVRCKSYIAGRPLVHKLIPAVGIIAFAAWGLVPLVRLGRVVLFNRTDNSWKKSSSHHVTTSYIQPILFWTGALFICRALEPLVLPTEASQAVKQRLLNFLRSLSTVLAFAHCLSSLIQQVQKYFMETNDSSDARNMGFGFAGKAVYTAVWVAAVSLFMELLGFSTQKWVTAGGLGTVLLTLAGREIFTNFLSSVMIQATRPFIVNEWIQTKIEGYEVSGTVEHVGWWSPTIIRGDDREAIHIPNHKFTVNIVRNLSQKTHWRVKTHLAISHLDVSKINNIVADMRKVLAKNSQVEQQRLHRRVFLDNVNPENQALMIMVSCFVKTSHFEEYLCVKEAILLDLLRVISHHRARLATPIRTVRKVYGETDLDNVPFADSPFSRSRALNRSYLLIEPSYKINDDKSKASTRSVHINEDTLGVQAEATSTSDPKTSDQVKALTLTSNPITNSTRPTPPSDSESQNLASDGSSSKLESTGYDGKKKVGVDRKDKSPLGETSEKLQATSSESGNGNGKRESSSTTVQSKQDDEKPHASPSTATPPLEDNIVLGVALEGSKRTLPIEEETSPAPTESKEMAAGQKGDLLPVGKDAKDVQKPPISGSKSSD